MNRKSISGFTLPEMIVSTALITMIFAALVTASVYVQRSVTAGQMYAQRQAQQLQVTDYLARDVRNAREITVENLSDRKKVTIKVPDYYDGDGNLRDPEFDNQNGATYGTTLRTIVYSYLFSDALKPITRTSDLRWDQASLTLAEDVETFDVVQDTANRTVQISMTFLPEFSYSDSSVPTIRDGTLAVSETLRRNSDIED